jgi:hypothetical protein
MFTESHMLQGVVILSGRLRLRSHLVSTTISVLLAAGVSIVVNVWTSGWAWSAGVGLAVLIVCQVAVECFRSNTADWKSSPRRRLAIEQRLGDVRGAHVTGVRRSLLNGDVKVRQRFRNVDTSRIVGIEEVQS